jgi:ribosome modulation factor
MREEKLTMKDKCNAETAKPRGMAVAQQRGRDSAAKSEPVSACPYRNRAWRSAWLTSYQKHSQMSLLDE